MWKEGASIAISHLDVILLSSSVKTSPYATRTRFPSEIFLPLTSDSSNCAERPERLSSLLLNDHLRGDVDFSLAGPLKRPNRGQPLLFMVDIWLVDSGIIYFLLLLPQTAMLSRCLPLSRPSRMSHVLDLFATPQNVVLFTRLSSRHSKLSLTHEKSSVIGCRLMMSFLIMIL